MRNYIRWFLLVFAIVLVLDIGGNYYILSNHPSLALGTTLIDAFWLIVFLNALAIIILGAAAAGFLWAQKIAIEFHVGREFVE